MRVALDVMGGDFAPHNPIAGAKLALDEIPDLELTLVGDSGRVQPLLEKSGCDMSRCRIVHASQVVNMTDSSTIAFKRKKDSSISVALTLHRLDNVDAVVSAGNTGAVVATSMIALSRIEGILRPVIGSILPTRGLPCLLMDVGANPDCRAIHLLQFGIMGSIYMQEVIGIDNPPVGLLSIGSEDNKGNELTLFANTLFSESHLNFIGNIEGSDLLSGKAAVAVCDGFTGNLILKFAESFPAFLAESIKVSGNGSAAEAVRLIDAKFNPDDYGGVPILGVNGISVVCHGNASPKAITSAVKAAVQAHHSGINEIIRDKVSEVNRFYAMNKYFQHLRDRWEKRRQRIYMNPRRFFNWFSDKEPEKD